ncbi:MAG: hypothetical protein QNK31_00315 [Porticoccus sp.]|nr:hypothetical protein [Porticoccus sp.]
MRYLIRTALAFDVLKDRLLEHGISAEEISAPIANSASWLLDVELEPPKNLNHERLLATVQQIEEIEQVIPTPDAEPF